MLPDNNDSLYTAKFIPIVPNFSPTPFHFPEQFPLHIEIVSKQNIGVHYSNRDAISISDKEFLEIDVIQ